MSDLRIYLCATDDAALGLSAARRAIARLQIGIFGRFDIHVAARRAHSPTAPEPDSRSRTADIVVAILGKSLGERLPEDRFAGPLSGREVSAVEYEIEDVLRVKEIGLEVEVVAFRFLPDDSGPTDDAIDTFLARLPLPAIRVRSASELETQIYVSLRKLIERNAETWQSQPLGVGAGSWGDTADIEAPAGRSLGRRVLDFERLQPTVRTLGSSPAMPAADAVITEAVEFAVSHPQSVRVAVPFLVGVWAFRPGDRQEAADRANRLSGEEARFNAQGSAAVARGSALTVTVEIPSWTVEPASQSVLWLGEIASVSFQVTPSQRPETGAVIGACKIFSNGLRIAQIFFTVNTAEAGSAGVKIASGAAIKSAFASYASKDRWRVLPRVQGIEKLGVSVFMDVHNLRSGQAYERELLERIEGADVLYLFWSRHARASRWVDREWRFGMEQRGIDFIDPVPLADPRKVPPPPELGDSKHFHDWTLAYLEAEKAQSLWTRLRSWIAGG